jgi:hypothetical protein
VGLSGATQDQVIAVRFNPGNIANANEERAIIFADQQTIREPAPAVPDSCSLLLTGQMSEARVTRSGVPAVCLLWWASSCSLALCRRAGPRASIR